MVFATPNMRQDASPETWREHYFGLSATRWRQLAGQGFWIIGAGTGYGQAIAVALALAGARPILSGRRVEKLVETREQAIALGAVASACELLPCDVTDEAQIGAAIEQIALRGIPLHGQVHSAAQPQPSGSPTPLQTLNLARWESLMRTNVTAPWLTMRAAMSAMLGAGAARVVLLSSEAGWAWTPAVGPYNISKAALNNLGLSLAGEFAVSHPQADVQLNILVPGEARTEMNQGSTESPFTAVPMMLRLLSQPPGGPNGYLFHRDGRHLAFGHRGPYHRSLD
jgi:NAD(P)-dependent dehydrogenase (short-subunit alcohol dehydrogenase family)